MFNVPFAIDKTNLEDHFLRNQIRHQVVEKYNSQERKKILEEIEEENKNLAQIIEKVSKINANSVEEKFKNLPYELFSVNDLKTLIKHKNLSCFDVCRGLVIHELFHYLITVKSPLEEYKTIYNGKEYKCKGVIGEYLEEGLVELYARMFALKHNLFMFPNINYQDNIKFVLKLSQEIGSNMDKLVFNSDYLGLLNYVHKNGLKEEYSSLENAWLEKRMISRFDKMNEIKEEEIEELMMEEI